MPSVQCTCTITKHERQENRACPVHFPVKPDAVPSVSLADFRALYRAYVNTLESGRDRLRDFGCNCDPVDVMERGDPALIRARKVMEEAK